MSAPARRPDFLRDARGVASIELVVWLPFFLAMLLVVVELSFFCLRYAQMVDATRETARAVALGLVAEREEAVEAAVRARLGASFDASIRREGRDVTVRVAAPLAVVSVFEILDLVVDEVDASATMRLEPEF
jgi:hypothetical protein